MSYSEPLINQPRVLLLSVGVGALLCLIYIIIQAVFRLFGQGRLSYYIADSLFCTVLALVSFFFMVLYAGGRVRLYLLAGEAAGFFLFYYSVGRYIYTAAAAMVKAVKDSIIFLLKPIFIFGAFIAKKYKRIKIFVKKKMPFKLKEKEADEKKNKKINLFGKIHLKNLFKSV